MRYVSLFAGIGGFDLALDRLGHECVYANDFDKYCKNTYDKNFKHKLDTRSITEVGADEIPDHDLLVGGFPCQSFSIAGKREGFNDTRGTLFFDVARIIKKKRPKFVLLENVAGLLSHDQGRTYKVILSTLAELGYDTEALVFNSVYFNAAPRKRVYMFAVDRKQAPDYWKGTEQTTPLYFSLSKGIRDTQNNRQQEDLRNAGRIIREFAKLPDWLDSWDILYPEEEAIR